VSDEKRLLIPRPGGLVRWSDVDPAMAIHAAINRLRLAEQRGLDCALAILDRLEAPSGSGPKGSGQHVPRDSADDGTDQHNGRHRGPWCVRAPR
jgi:hypothetical protein